MPPQARLTDLHMCPIHGPTPIVGVGAPTVLVGKLPAARNTDFATCIQPAIPPVPIPDPIVKGSATVYMQKLMAARISDPHTHGGMVQVGMPTVMTGG